VAPVSLSKNLLGLFLRRVCPGCGSDLGEEGFLCPWCRLRIVPCPSAHWSGNGSVVTESPDPGPDLNRGIGIPVYSAVLFEGLPGEILRRLKFGGEKYLAATSARLILTYSSEVPGRGDLIVPVPAGRKRKRERGYNQASLIAGRLASGTGADMSRLLVRDDSPSQVGLTTAQRRRNVEGVFHPRRGARIPDGVRIWLVDDVATTFSTIHSAAAALLSGGAESVTGLTMAYRKKEADSIIRLKCRGIEGS
jgi:ComF family protein